MSERGWREKEEEIERHTKRERHKHTKRDRQRRENLKTMISSDPRIIPRTVGLMCQSKQSSALF